jgi:hypothetical protein
VFLSWGVAVENEREYKVYAKKTEIAGTVVA